MRRDVFQAIADPNRRAILNLLVRQSLTLNGLAEHFRISRQAVTKHVRILADSGLVLMHRQGREQYCEARPEKLTEVSDWIEQTRRIWDARLDQFEDYLVHAGYPDLALVVNVAVFVALLWLQWPPYEMFGK